MVKLDARERRVDEEIERVAELATLAIPTVLAAVTLFVPMFRYVDIEDGEQSTLIGLVFEPGGTGPTTALVLSALVAVVGLVASAMAVPAWARQRSGWPGTVIGVASSASLVAAFVLWVLTNQNDSGGRFGDEAVDPTMQLLLAFVTPIWFLSARFRSR